MSLLLASAELAAPLAAAVVVGLSVPLATANAAAGEVPGALVTLEVTAPLRAGFVPSALPTRFVLLEDGQVFVGGTIRVTAGRLDKGEVKAIERRLDQVRKLWGLGGEIAFDGAATPRHRLQARKSKLDLVATGDPRAAPPALQPVAALIGDLSSFHHPSLRPYEPASLALEVREAPLPGGCRAWTLPVPLAEALAGPTTLAASDAYEWPTGGVPAAVCEGDRRFVVTLRALLPGERPGSGTPP